MASPHGIRLRNKAEGTVPIYSNTEKTQNKVVPRMANETDPTGVLAAKSIGSRRFIPLLHVGLSGNLEVLNEIVRGDRRSLHLERNEPLCIMTRSSLIREENFNWQFIGGCPPKPS